jgi:hypothetical protein
MNIPEIKPQQIATAMGLSLNSLYKLVRKPERNYHPTRHEADKKGKVRILDVPRYQFKCRMKKLHRFLQKELVFPSAAHGGVRKRSSLSSARKHLGQAVVITRDAQDCFPSIKRRLLGRELRALGFRPDTVNLLLCLLTVHGRVPQGSPTSNDAVNLFFWRQDLRIQGALALSGGRFSRNADDLVASTNGRLGAEEKAVEALESAIEFLGLAVNQKKKDDHGRQGRDTCQYVHGVVVNSASGIRPSGDHLRQALSSGEEYVAAARSVSPPTLMVLAKKRAVVQGWMAYFRGSARSNSKHLGHLLRAGDRHVDNHLREAGLEAQRTNWWVKSRRRPGPERLALIWQRKVAPAL